MGAGKKATSSSRKLLWITGTGATTLLAAWQLLPNLSVNRQLQTNGPHFPIEHGASPFGNDPADSGGVIANLKKVFGSGVRWRDLDTSGWATRSVVHWASDACESPEQRVALVRLGGPYILDWLLKLGCADARDVSDESREHAQRALAYLLSEDVTASTLLLRPGAVPKLLACLADDRASAELAAAMDVLAGRRNVLQGDTFVADLVAVLKMLRAPPESPMGHLRHHAANFLTSWAAGSAATRHKLAGLGLHTTITQVVAGATGGTEDRDTLKLQWALMRTLRVLLDHGTAGEAHHLACCVEPVLYIGADAAVAQDQHLLLKVVDALAACAARAQAGGPVRAALIASGCSPLLRRIVSQGARPELEAHVVRALHRLILSDALPAAEVPWWRDWMLGRLCASGVAGGTEELRAACISALQTLAALPGPVGLQASHYWLAKMLARLADQVAPYNTVVYVADSGLRDPEQLLDVAPVLPKNVKAVARELERASDALATSSSDDSDISAPTDLDLGLPLPKRRAAAAASKAQAAAQRVVQQLADAIALERKVCEALDMLCSMVAVDPSKQQWLASVGVLPLLQQLCTGPPAEAVAAAAHAIPAAATVLGKASAAGVTGSADDEAARAVKGIAEEPVYQEVYSDHDGAAHLLLRRQTARLLALLALHPETHSALAATNGMSSSGGGSSSSMWRDWLQHASQSSDCRLSSHATKALLNLEAYSAQQRTAASDGLYDALTKLPHPSARPSRPPPIFHDMIHLLNPRDPHHLLLAKSLGDDSSAASFARMDSWTLSRPSDENASGDSARVDLDTSQTVTAPTAPTGETTEVVQAALTSTDASMAAAAPLDVAQPARSGLSTADAPSQIDEGHEGPTGDGEEDMAALALTLPPAVVAQRRRQHLAGRLAARAQPPQASPQPANGAQQQQQQQQSSPATSGASVSSRSHGVSDSGSAAKPGETSGTGSVPDVPGAAAAPGAARIAPGRSSAPAAADRAPEDSGTQTWFLPADAQHKGELPMIDVIFVHGIRGGPFITWRTIDPTTGKPRASANMVHSDCWPSQWLPNDLPRARLLTVEYPAPVSAWEGESLPLEDTVTRVSRQLVAAGVGSRPAVFITHSMGGLLVKEILARGLTAMEHRLPPAVASAAPGGHSEASAPRAEPVGAQQRTGDIWSRPVQQLAVGSVKDGTAATVAANAATAAGEKRDSPLLAQGGSPGSEQAGLAASAIASDTHNNNNNNNSASAVGGNLKTASGERTGSPAMVMSAEGEGVAIAAAPAPKRSADGPDAMTLSVCASLASCTRGLVFFATPHFGSKMAAAGWKLRHLPGAAPAPSLARLSPGPHLIQLNEALRRLYDARHLALLSFIEVQPTALAGFGPKIVIVPQESAYPGFGDGVVLSSCNHINVCKPVNQDAPAYDKVLQLLHDVMDRTYDEAEEGSG